MEALHGTQRHQATSDAPLMTQPLRTLARSEGFTLIELAAVIAIILTITGVLIPAVQRVREAANRTQTAAVLTDLAASLQDFHRTNGQFPDVWEKMLNFTKAADGAVSGYQLIPQLLSADEVIIAAEPAAGVTGSEVLWLRVTPQGDGTSLRSTPIAGADTLRSQMLARLFHFVSQEIAAMAYLLPLSEQGQWPEQIVPSTDASLKSPEVLAALTSLTHEGVFSLASFLAGGDDVAIENDAARRRLTLLTHGTGAILGLGTFNEEPDYAGLVLTSVLGQHDTVAEVLYSFGVLTELTIAFMSDERGRKAGYSAYDVGQIERELLLLLSQARDADRRGDEELKSRWLAQYVALVKKMEGVLLSKLQADALITIAKAL